MAILVSILLANLLILSEFACALKLCKYSISKLQTWGHFCLDNF